MPVTVDSAQDPAAKYLCLILLEILARRQAACFWPDLILVTWRAEGRKAWLSWLALQWRGRVCRLQQRGLPVCGAVCGCGIDGVDQASLEGGPRFGTIWLLGP